MTRFVFAALIVPAVIVILLGTMAVALRRSAQDQVTKEETCIGYVTRQEDGSFKGQLRTLSIRADIEIVPNRTKNSESQPDYRIVTNSVEVGAGWRRTSRDTGASYVSLSLAAPEFGPRKLYANLGRAAGQDDDSVFAVIWNPAD